ncbi:MAG: thymidine phosphorylase [Kiritimatiellae bacterium]|nr:thymidine phosphorylase [Kiritimatiellia bacterium]
MIPQWIIEKKRDHKALSEEEIRFFIDGYTREEIPDYQMAAMAMAIYLNGMTFEETAILTDAMMHSGDLVDTSSIKFPKVDKHSTGGIGDKVSLILAPLMACCNVAVPMVSGRGLGITGGTLDKLESIPGCRTNLSDAEFVDIVQTCGCSITGQTGQLAPADKKLYALRDVTATVPSIPLIVASIMCKKLAEGIDALVLDVKWGQGAFMKTQEQARELAENMVEVGTRMGKKMAAIISDMNQPLGCTTGNALEVIESLEALSGNGSKDLMEVTMTLCTRMLMLTEQVKQEEEAIRILEEHIASGAALSKFKEMVKLQGGDVGVLEDPARLPVAGIKQEFPASESGYISKVDAEPIGRACLMLGAGRTKINDPVDFAVGISNILKIGDLIEKGSPLLTVHANDKEKLNEALILIQKAFDISEEKPSPTPFINDTIVPQ